MYIVGFLIAANETKDFNLLYKLLGVQVSMETIAKLIKYINF